MATQELKDKNGNLIGKIVEEGGRLVIKDRNGNKKGSYDPRTNTTYEKNGNKIGSGNLLVTLL